MKKTTILVPTYDESENIGELADRIKMACSGLEHQVLVVNDSPDDLTSRSALEAGCMVIHRRDKERGLSRAVIDGIKATDSENIAVMDGDIQHDPKYLPRLIEALEKHDFVVMSRYIKGGGCEEWGLGRRFISLVANLFALPLVPQVRDLASGFFGFRRGCLSNRELESLDGTGFKIMLELLVKGNWQSIGEVPYTFRPRMRGETKMRFGQVWAYLVHLARLYLYKWRWLRFGIIGASGTLIYFPILYTLTEFAMLPYLVSAVVGIVCASTSNYFLNHYWTFSGQREVAHNHFLGWGKYQMMSGVTDGAYLGLLALLVELGGMYYMLSAGLAMVAIFLVKYFVARHWIWNKPRAEPA